MTTSTLPDVLLFLSLLPVAVFVALGLVVLFRVPAQRGREGTEVPVKSANDEDFPGRARWLKEQSQIPAGE